MKWGDLVHLQNQYGSKGYLDTHGSHSASTQLYDVSTSTSKDRADAGTATWEIIKY